MPRVLLPLPRLFWSVCCMSHRYVAIDLGAESGRVMLGELSDSGIALTEVHRFGNGAVRVGHEGGKTLHWDVLRLWQEIQVGLGKVVAEHGGGGHRRCRGGYLGGGFWVAG